MVINIPWGLEIFEGKNVGLHLILFNQVSDKISFLEYLLKMVH